jgi:hypothetical protein
MCIAIYEQIARVSFPPYVHYRDYARLFLSDKQIRNEIKYD